MKLLRDGLRYDGLFMKLFIFTVSIIILVSVTITAHSLRMSERFFIETFSITNAKVMSQVKERFESFNYTVVLATHNFQQNGTIKSILLDEPSNAKLMNSYYEMNKVLNRIKANLDTYDAGIMVMGINGISYSTDRSFWPMSDEEWSEHQITHNTINNPRKIMYQYYHINDEQIIVASKALIDRISGNVYGSIYFAIKESDFKQFYTSLTSPGNDLFLLDNSGMIVSSNRVEMIGEWNGELLAYMDDVIESPEKYIYSQLNGAEYIILTEHLPFFDMYLVNTIDRDIVYSSVINEGEIVLISMSIVLISLIILFFFSRRLTNSLSSLVKQIENTPKHNFHNYVSVSGTYETRQIANAFNEMLHELHDYVEKLMLSQKEKRNAELAALQQQINPHFLYNTLASIKFMVQQGGKEDATNTINALISLLQNTLGNVSETITVEQELDNLKNYIFINQKRYGNGIKVNYFVAPESREVNIPKLILQPFVENAFFHAFNKKLEGAINIMIWQEKGTLICEVMDNGDGMEIEDVNIISIKKNHKRPHFSGIGVRNVHERIQIIYGKNYGVQITSNIGEGTKVRVTLPVTSKNSYRI